MATLARGGRLNIFGFVLRLAGMVPFLFIGGRIYGPAALGRFAYAVLTVEFAAQIAALGLRRGLAQLLANAKKPQACVVADALLVAAIGSAIGMAILIVFPKAMYPTTPVGGLDRLLAITVLAIAWTDIALAGAGLSQRCRRDRPGALDRPAVGRSASPPWPVVRADHGQPRRRADHRLRPVDGRGAGRRADPAVALLRPAARLEAGPRAPHGARPCATCPLAAADTVEWASRRIDLAVLGAFVPASFVGIYYAAQQVATLPAKLKTSFEPVLGPAIVRRIAVDDRAGDRQAGPPGHLLDHRRAGRDCLGARHSGPRGDGAGRIANSPAAPRCSASCSPPK